MNKSAVKQVLTRWQESIDIQQQCIMDLIFLLSGETSNKKPKDPNKRRGKSKTAPSDFILTDAMLDWWNKEFPTKPYDVKEETKIFLDHEYKSGRMDWTRAWKNWMRRKVQYSNKDEDIKTADQINSDKKTLRINKLRTDLAELQSQAHKLKRLINASIDDHEKVAKYRQEYGDVCKKGNTLTNKINKLERELND